MLLIVGRHWCARLGATIVLQLYANHCINAPGACINPANNVMAKKKNSSGRPRGYEIDSNRLRERIEQRSQTYEGLAKAAAFYGDFPEHASAYSRVVKNSRASLSAIKALCTILDMLPDEFVTDPRFVQEVKEDVVKTVKNATRVRRTQERTLYRGGRAAVNTQDIKNVIWDPKISERLLGAESLPSLHEAVLASKVRLTDHDEEKDQTQKEIGVNHFLSVGAIVTLKMLGDPKTYAVAVHRERDKFPADYQHTYGRSPLISASFSFGLKVSADREMEDWVYRVDQEPSLADKLFMKLPGAVLLGLLAHKYRPGVDQSPTIRPLGVVTRDERPEAGKAHRIYSMYLFHIHTKLDRPIVPRERFAQDVLVKPETGSMVAVTPANESLWVRKGGKKNLMDIVVWRGLMSNAAMKREEQTHFVRGFSLV